MTRLLTLIVRPELQRQRRLRLASWIVLFTIFILMALPFALLGAAQ
jgi:hypothetical protein